MIHWYIADRQRGKTEDLITWVKGGHEVNYYPGWNRVILVSSRQEADRLRGGGPATNRYGLHYQQVYYLDEWKHMAGLRGPVEIGIDNVEFFLNRMLFNTYGTIVRATATGTTAAWPEVIDRQLMEDK